MCRIQSQCHNDTDTSSLMVVTTPNETYLDKEENFLLRVNHVFVHVHSSVILHIPNGTQDTCKSATDCNLLLCGCIVKPRAHASHMTIAILPIPQS